MATTYSTWTVSSLKDELKLRKASTKGKKADLITRLDAYDRNCNFQFHTTSQSTSANQKTTQSFVWPKDGYQSVAETDFLPKITTKHVENYFIMRYERERIVGDVKAIEKGKAMVSAFKVKACSALNIATDVFFSGIVAAEMKRHVLYNVKARMARDGVILNAECECPGGKGPTGSCKHLAALCLMISQYMEHGRLFIDESCTEKLQTFHRPQKVYKGKISKMQDLYPPPSVTTAPLDTSSNYRDHVRSTFLNYCATTSKDLAIRYVYGKADLRQAAMDHDYLELPFTEYWIDRSLKITQEEAQQIQEKTLLQSECKNWHRDREWRITASRFGEVIKATSRRNIELLCEDILASRSFSSPGILHGRAYEPVAIEAFTTVTGIEAAPCGLFINSTFPYLGATPDAKISPDGLVEVKCPYNGRNSHITAASIKLFPFLAIKNQNLQLRRNHNYYYQIQGQLGLSDRNYCYFVVYTFNDLFLEKITFDKHFFENNILPPLASFYENHWRPFLSAKFLC